MLFLTFLGINHRVNNQIESCINQESKDVVGQKRGEYITSAETNGMWLNLSKSFTFPRPFQFLALYTHTYFIKLRRHFFWNWIK